MTLPQAITELEDRGVSEVVDFLKRLELDLRYKEDQIALLQNQIDMLKYGGF